MSPLEINVLLWIYARPTDFDQPSPAATEAHHMFLRSGMIEKDTDEDRWVCTVAGLKLVDMLCKTPFPVNVWIDPRTKQ